MKGAIKHEEKLSAFIALVVLTTTQVHADQQEPSTTPTSIDVPSPSKLSASNIANMITYEFGATHIQQLCLGKWRKCF